MPPKHTHIWVVDFHHVAYFKGPLGSVPVGVSLFLAVRVKKQ